MRSAKSYGGRYLIGKELRELGLRSLGEGVNGPLAAGGIYTGLPARCLRDRSWTLLAAEHQLLAEEASKSAR
jgi:hypothetical protein